MPRPKGSKNPDYIQTDALKAQVALASEMDHDELLVARSVITQVLADNARRSDEPSVSAMQARYAALCDLDAADRACRKATGLPLRTTKDYARYAPDGAANIQKLYRLFKCGWAGILRDAGIAAASNPTVLLTMSFAPGRNGRTERGQDRYSEAEKDRAFAAAVELCSGRCPTRKQYDRAQELSGPGFPSYTAVVKRSGKTLTHDACYRRAIDVIRQAPDWYPLAARYLSSKGLL